MNIYIAGINHLNPKHRIKLEALYKSLMEKHKCPPLFIALEYEQNFALEMIAQRESFYNLCRLEWPNISEEVIRIITDSLLFEVDAHRIIFGETALIWLDEGRIIRRDVVDEYARDRLNVYKSFITEYCSIVKSENILDVLDSISETRTLGFEASNRDKQFSDIICSKAREYNNPTITNAFALVVVGSNHAKDCIGSMKNLLDMNEIRNEVVFM